MSTHTLNERLLQQVENLAQRKGISPNQLLTDWLAAEPPAPQPDPSVDERLSLLKLLTENAIDMICLHHPDSTYLYVSPAAQQIGGYDPQELIGTVPYDYFHPDDLEHIHTSYITSLGGQNVYNTTYRFRRKDGEYIWLETFTAPVLNDQQQVISLVTISRDITQRRQTEEDLKYERDLLSRIMETSPSGIVVVDNTGQITFANRRAEEIMGLTKESITARTYDAPVWKHTEYDGSPWPDEKQPFVRVMQTKAPVWDVRHAIVWPDGRRVFLAINGAPILDEHNEVSEVVFTIEDYTQRKYQQDELEQALKREKYLNEMKSAFVSTVSHEFRTPMAIIMASSFLLRKKHLLMSEADFFARLDKIEGQIERLNNLIEDVTFISKSDLVGHQVHPARIIVSQFFAQLVDEIQMTYPHHQPIALHHEGPADIALLDFDLMQKIFVNLLSNAMKYSPAISTVTCTIRCAVDMLTVIIQDQGIGIPLSDQINLFSDFHRASNVGNISGTGLGLAIVKRAVDTLNGTITFESQPGQGTQFIVSLPFSAPALS